MYELYENKVPVAYIKIFHCTRMYWADKPSSIDSLVNKTPVIFAVPIDISGKETIYFSKSFLT